MSDDSEFSQQIQVGWINWFCTLEDHHFLIQIDQAYIRDSLNLYGLKSRIQRYDEALNMILRHRPPSQVQIQDPKFLELYQIATQLYGLIHARFIQTPAGLASIREKYLTGKFGNCPRVMCENQNVIPVGMSTDCKISRIKIYCPRCKDIYNPKKKFADIDGSFFGPSFPYLLIMTYPDLGSLFKKQQHVPTLFGFKIEQQNPEAIVRLEKLNNLKIAQNQRFFEDQVNNKPQIIEQNSSKVVSNQQKKKKNKKR